MTEKKYLDLGNKILDEDNLSDNRTGIKTYKTFGASLEFDLSNGTIPLLTTKKVNFNSVLTELLWFLNGNTNVNALKKCNNNIWNSWADCDGNLGPMYGAMWRRRPVSLGITGNLVSLQELQAKVKRTDDIIEMEQEAIEQTVALNLDWKQLREKHPEDFATWTNMLGYCGGRFISAMLGQKMSVTTKMEANRAQRKSWAENIINNTLWVTVDLNMFANVSPSEIYKPWLSFKNFLQDIGRIAYNESPYRKGKRITSFFHGVRFYAPWSTAFMVEQLDSLAKRFMATSSGDTLQKYRPRIVIDQIDYIVKTLDENPMSRRMVVNSWEPSFIPDESIKPCENPSKGLQALTPCHHDWQVVVNKTSFSDLKDYIPDDVYFKAAHEAAIGDQLKMQNVINNLLAIANQKRAKDNLPPIGKYVLNLRFSMRSSDFFLGLPFNIAEYGILLHILAKKANMSPGKLLYQGTDVHIYENTVEAFETQAGNQIYDFPKLEIKDFESIDDLTKDHFVLKDYVSAGAITASVAV